MKNPSSLWNVRSRVNAAVPSKLSRGVGLIDVLIAMVVLAGGVAGLAKMQAVVLEESGNAKARSVAVQLATAKLDDLRSYAQIAAGGAGIFGYAEIGNNAGGSENNDGSLRLASGTVTVANTTFTRNWTSQGLNYCVPNAAPQAALCAGQPVGSLPQAKALTVTVTWPDTEGLTQAVTLSGTVNSIDPISAISSLLLSAAEGPIVTYVPGQAPQVIAIGTGGGRKIETTNPTPSLVKKGQQVVNTIARYETVSFDASNQTQRRRQFTTINCLCEQAGTGQGEDRFGNIVTKRTGVPADQFQAFECDICCRDHHDRASDCNPSTEAGRKGCYDPDRWNGTNADGTNPSLIDLYHASGDHKHFSANGQPADDQGDVYVEACRMERIDGYLRVVPDWRLGTVNAIPADFFTPANVTAYGTWVKEYVASVMNGTAAPAPIWSTSELVNQGAQRPLLARAVYIDYLDSAQKSAYATRIAANDPTVFQEIPFYEVNMTKLAQWSSSTPAIASVSNDPLVAEAEGQNLYSRGVVTGLSPGATNATARVRLGNTGVINEFISTDTQDGTLSQSPSATITVPGTTYTAIGTISGIPTSAVVTVAATGTGGSPNVACSYAGGSTSFSCTLPSGWNGNITASATNYTFAPGALTITNLAANQGSLVFVASTGTSAYTISGLISPSVSDAVVTASGIGANANVACTYGGSGSYSCAVPAGWSGTILPSSVTSTFTPGSYPVTGIAADQTSGFDFTSSAAAGSYTISGTIESPPSTVTVTMVANPSTATCGTVAANGDYSCTVPAGWTGTLSPTVDAVLGAGITFVSPARTYATGVSSNLSGENYVAHYRISGKVSRPSPDTSLVTGVTFSATGTGSSNGSNGICTYDGTTGNYACVVPGGWTGNVQPLLSNNTFSPVSRPYSPGVSAPVVNENYIATAVATQNYSITVTLTGLNNSQSTAISSFTGLTCVDGGPPKRTGTGSNKVDTIICTVLSGWNGTITPTVNTGAANKSCTLLTSGGTPTAPPLGQTSATFNNVTSNRTLSFAGSGNGC